jgi:hypothetical protein
VEIRDLSSVEIIRAIVDRIGCKLNAFNEDGVYRRDRRPGGCLGFIPGLHNSAET